MDSELTKNPFSFLTFCCSNENLKLEWNKIYNDLILKKIKSFPWQVKYNKIYFKKLI